MCFNRLLTMILLLISIFADNKAVFMNSFFKHIASFVLSFLLLMSISGITVYSHYCHGSNFETSSLFQDEASCEHDKHNYCTDNPESCCTEKSSCKTEHANSDCCENSEKQIKLIVDFDILKQHKKVKSVFDFIFEELIFSPLENYFVDNIQTIEINEIETAVGKQLLVFLHQLKTEPNPHC